MESRNSQVDLIQVNFSSALTHENRLVSSPTEVHHLPDLVQFVHDQFRALVLDRRFPCAGAKSAVQRGTYMFGMYSELGSCEASEALCLDLKKFIVQYLKREVLFTTFVASFIHPAGVAEHYFEALLWKQLQSLHNMDENSWCPAVSSDPDDPHFAFSFAGHPFFVIGLHAGSSRWARRFAWPTLIFNAHRQFEHLRESGKFEHFQQVVRVKDQSLQGVVNPNLIVYQGLSAARQYSGRFVEERWACPFHQVMR